MITNIYSYEYSQTIIYRDYSTATPLDTALDTLAGGPNNIRQAANAVTTLSTVLNSTSLQETVKNQISTVTTTTKITDILISFVKALNNSSTRQIINNLGMATSVTIDGKTISQSIEESQVRDIITSVKPVEPLTAPTISPSNNSGLVSPVTVTITAASGTTIRYTTDGSEPSLVNGIIYSASFIISKTTTIKTVAIRDGVLSSVSSVLFSFYDKASKPSMNPAGGTYSTAQTVSMTTATPGATIKYTTDGSAPSETNGMTYSAPITISATATLKAVAIKNGVISDIASHTYTIAIPVAIPVINPTSGSYPAPLEITITCATAGATIFYTDNGTDPTISSNQYNSTQKITLNQSKTIKAIAAKPNATTGSVAYSEIAAAFFNIMQKAATPSFNLPAGTYNGEQSVTINTTTPGADIYYTTDGSEPSETAIKYSDAITVNSSMTINAVAIKPGMANSEVASVNYTINPAKVEEPEFDLATGTYSTPKYVSLTCATPGASIYYTDDGTTPSASSKLYNPTNKIYINSSAIVEIRAVAIKNGMQNSSIVSRAYRIDQNAALFNIQYYSDSSLQTSLGDKPYLKAGTYYLKITSSKALRQAPSVTINAEGTANDIISQPAVPFSGNDYRLTRVISYDADAAGLIQESITIDSTDAAGITSNDVKPANEANKAAYTDTIAPTATITYSKAFPIKQGDSFTITADLSEEVKDTPPLKISLSSVNTLAAVNMNKVTSSRYQYAYTAQSGSGAVNILLSGATDKAGNPIVQTPANGSFTLDNSVPPQPGNITITVDGEEKRQNTLNSTSTNMIVTANIAPGKAVGGKAELYIGDSTTPVASDLSITSGDDIVTFDLETNTNAGLKTKIPAGGEVRVRLYNSVGNYTDSTANPLLIVDYDKPAAPSITSFIATGGTVYSGKLNSTNTNFTVSATIPAGQATGGKAELFIGNNRVRIVEPLLSTQSTVEFKVLDIASAYNLQSAIQEPGGEIKVKLYDSAGNYIFSSSNPSVSAKYSALSAPTKVSLSPIGGTVVANTLNSTNTNLTATAEIALGEAAGGKAELYIGSTKIAEDTSIGAYDAMVSFDCGAAAEFSLQSKIPNSGQVSVKLYDSYGNFAESSGGPTLTVKYNRPTAPSNITVTPVGGIVVTNRLNATNTNLTATANITAGSATGGRAELYVGDTKIAEDTSIDALDTTVNFDCGATSTATLQNKIK